MLRKQNTEKEEFIVFSFVGVCGLLGCEAVEIGTNNPEVLLPQSAYLLP
jgi:hypothetical protein